MGRKTGSQRREDQRKIRNKRKAGKIFKTDMIVPENEDVSSGLIDSKLFAQRDTTILLLNQPIEV